MPSRTLTIALPQELYDEIEKRAKDECRSKGSQIVYLLRLGIKYREDANERAFKAICKPTSPFTTELK